MQAKDLKPGWWLTRDGDSLLYMSLGVGSDGLLYVGYRSGGDFQVGWFGPGEEVTHHPDCTGWDYVIPKRVKLEVGKRYVMRNCKPTRPIYRSGDPEFVWEDGERSWTANGKYWNGSTVSDSDIVSEYVEPPAIDPGEGWRLLEDDEVVEDGDWHTSIDGRWCPCIGSVGMMVANIPNRWAIKAFRRRIPPAHVPFTQHTFRPHAKKWLYEKSMPDHWFRPQEIKPHAVLIGALWVEWDRLLSGFEFEGGDICGVKHG